MKLKTPISFWRKGNSLTEQDGFLEDLHAEDVYYLKGRDSFNDRLRAVSDAEIKDDEVFVPSESFNSCIESTRVNSSLQIHTSKPVSQYHAKAAKLGTVETLLSLRRDD